MDRFIECWDGLNDPRTGTAALHDFHEILAIAMCAVLCGGQGSVDMGLFAKAKDPFLRGFLRLENGVLSHDTFSCRLFRMLMRSSSGRRFSGSWLVSKPQAETMCNGDLPLALSNERRRTLPWIATTPSHGSDASNALCWRRSPPTPSRSRP